MTSVIRKIMTPTGSNPLRQFNEWLSVFKGDNSHKEVPMCLSTVGAFSQSDPTPAPTSRIVLLKKFSPEVGFTFYTNYDSGKGNALSSNPRVSLNFFWGDRQVRVEGVVKKATSEESDAYFAYRPRDSQLGAWASNQSQPLSDRQELEKRVQDVTDKFKDHDKVPRPPNWGGFHVTASRVEFWEAHPFRLHTRHVYERTMRVNHVEGSHTTLVTDIGEWSAPQMKCP